MKPPITNPLMFASMLAMAGAIDFLPEPKPPRIYTDADQQRREKAEAKRQRKAAKRRAQQGDKP
jgi:hypothetical protein